MSYIGRTDIPMGLSSARGWNPFPWQYRSDCVRESAITCLKNFSPNPQWPPFPDTVEALSLTVEGRYFGLMNFLDILRSRVDAAGSRLHASGRLWTVDGIQFSGGGESEPQDIIELLALAPLPVV